MATTVSDGPRILPREPEPVAAQREARRASSAIVKATKGRPRPARMVLPKPRIDDQSATIHEDASIVRARRLIATAEHREAHALLQAVLANDPDNVTCRRLLLKACIGLRRADDAAVQGDWLVAHFVRAEQDVNVCDVYARIVKSGLNAPWKETTLTTVALAAKRATKGSVLLDAATRLLALFPTCRALPSILLAAAERQAAKGRKDLARKTLRHIIERYPNHVEAMRAQQRLSRTLVPRTTR